VTSVSRSGSTPDSRGDGELTLGPATRRPPARFHARADVAARTVGAARAAFEGARDPAGEREQPGRPIGGFRAVRHKLAEMATDTEAARSLAYRAGAATESGDRSATRPASMAEPFASEHAVDVTDEAL